MDIGPNAVSAPSSTVNLGVPSGRACSHRARAAPRTRREVTSPQISGPLGGLEQAAVRDERDGLDAIANP